MPFGVSSSLGGNATPIQKRILMDFQLIIFISEIHPEDLLAKLHAGTLIKELKNTACILPLIQEQMQYAKEKWCTTAVRFGVMRDHVHDSGGLLDDGSVIHTGSLATKSYSVYPYLTTKLNSVALTN